MCRCRSFAFNCAIQLRANHWLRFFMSECLGRKRQELIVMIIISSGVNKELFAVRATSNSWLRAESDLKPSFVKASQKNAGIKWLEQFDSNLLKIYYLKLFWAIEIITTLLWANKNVSMTVSAGSFVPELPALQRIQQGKRSHRYWQFPLGILCQDAFQPPPS